MVLLRDAGSQGNCRSALPLCVQQCMQNNHPLCVQQCMQNNHPLCVQQCMQNNQSDYIVADTFGAEPATTRTLPKIQGFSEDVHLLIIYENRS